MTYVEKQGFGDLAIEVEAPSLGELFKEAAQALSASMADLGSVSQGKSITIKLEAKDIEHLLFDWLQELIFRKDAESFIVKNTEVSIVDETQGYLLSGTLHGETIDHDKHELKTDVKAVTMHDFSVKKKGNGWHAFVIFDL